MFQYMVLLLAVCQQEDEIRKARVFRDRTQPLDFMDDDELNSRYQPSRQCILEVCDWLSADLKRPTARSHSLPVSTQSSGCSALLCHWQFATSNW